MPLSVSDALTVTAVLSLLSRILFSTRYDSGYPIAFGRTSTGKYLAVVFEKVQASPPVAYPIAAYPVNPPRKKRRKK